MRKDDVEILQLNTVVNNSTGRIMHDIQCESDRQGYKTLSVVGRRGVYDDTPCVKYGSGLSFWIHVAITTVMDIHGYGSYFYSKKIIERLRKENPEIIHLHNIHGYYLNIPLLFRYLRDEYHGQIVWTLHDLWPITGHCAYYTAVGCNRWKTGCYRCPNKRRYPISLAFDNSEKNYADKKRLFSGIENLCITTPSIWMREQIKESYLSDYQCYVIHNGIDTAIFDYNNAKNVYNVKNKYSIPENKKVLLGVASIWDDRKGLKDLISLSSSINKDYIIVVVGLNNKQIKELPSNMIGIRRTEDVNELVSIYSMADIFINPSLEESFSLVTVEAQACGCPCIVLDTSAVAELVNESNGIVLHNHNSEDYIKAISELESREYTRKDIRDGALKYTNANMLNQYMELYEEILELDE